MAHLLQKLLFCVAMPLLLGARAENAVEDPCDGTFDAELQNMVPLSGAPWIGVDAAGYYDFAYPQNLGLITYALGGIEKVTVTAFAPYASFASWSGEKVIRGCTAANRETIKWRMRFDPAGDLLLAPTDRGLYFCRLVQNGYLRRYLMEPCEVPGAQNLPYYGLNLLASRDGVNFSALESTYTIRPSPDNLYYLEEHSAMLPPESRYLRLAVSLATVLDGVDNYMETPVQVCRVRFEMAEPPPAPTPHATPPPAPSPSPSGAPPDGPKVLPLRPAASGKPEPTAESGAIRREEGPPLLEREAAAAPPPAQPSFPRPVPVRTAAAETPAITPSPSPEAPPRNERGASSTIPPEETPSQTAPRADAARDGEDGLIFLIPILGGLCAVSACAGCTLIVVRRKRGGAKREKSLH